jgi:pyruvate dehydrogenase E2 component (dihydrolipoamide acetyltransferase)
MSLRQQARAGMVYAPGLTYVPATPAPAPAPARAAAPPAPPAAPAAAAPATAVIVAPPKPPAPGDPQAKAAAAPVGERTLFSMDEEELSLDQIACRWDGGGGWGGAGMVHALGLIPTKPGDCQAAHAPVLAAPPPSRPRAPAPHAQGVAAPGQAAAEGEERRGGAGALREGAHAVQVAGGQGGGWGGGL